MKIAVSEATEHQLDWMTAKATGHIRPDGGTYAGHQGRVFHPSTNWEHGGPLVDELIKSGCKLYQDNNDWPVCYDRTSNRIHLGSTILVAAIRCHITMKLGDEVDVPDELCVDHESKSDRETESAGDHPWEVN